MSESYELFHYDGCGFCYRVRSFLAKKNIDHTLRNIHEEPAALKELMTCGGRRTVPCLKIQRGNDSYWMYESMDIVAYLDDKFSHG